MDRWTLWNATQAIIIVGCLIWIGFIVLEPESDTDDSPKVPQLQVKVFTTSKLILDFQDESLGYKVFTVLDDEPIHLPSVQSYDSAKTFLGWCKDAEGHDDLLKPGAELTVNEDVLILYGIWALNTTLVC